MMDLAGWNLTSSDQSADARRLVQAVDPGMVLLSARALTRYLLLSANTRATGYDASGTLCVALTSKEKTERAELMAAIVIQVAMRRRRSRGHDNLEQRGRTSSNSKVAPRRAAGASVQATTDLL